MLKKILLLLVCFAIVIVPLTDAAAQTPKEDEEKEIKYPALETEEMAEGIAEGVIPVEKVKIDRWDIEIGFSSFQGYDSNASLDSVRTDDAFTQNSIDLTTKYILSDDWKLVFKWNEFDITYWEYTDASLYDNAVSFGFENTPSDNLIIYAGYELDVPYYPNSELSNYVGNRGEISIRHRINDKLYHKVSYDYLHKGYTERRARDAVANKSRHREDNRHTMEYELGTYLGKVMLKLKTTYYNNDSNDKYLDYYDYNSYKVAGTFIYLITDRLYAYTNSGYEFKDYKNRSSSTENEDEEDSVWTFNTSLFYDLTKSFSLGINYSYREVFSNDNSQEYSGNIVSAGLYYIF